MVLKMKIMSLKKKKIQQKALKQMKMHPVMTGQIRGKRRKEAKTKSDQGQYHCRSKMRDFAQACQMKIEAVIKKTAIFCMTFKHICKISQRILGTSVSTSC